MKQRILKYIALTLMLTGCAMPGKPTLRIAISSSPGSSVLYVAQESGLFRQYDVDVELVELNSGCECMQALAESSVEAAVVPYSEFASLPNSGSGILLLLAESQPGDPFPPHNHIRNDWHTSQTELLIGNRSELMTRREDWQRILLAYEHARMLLTGEPEVQARVIAEREQRSSNEVLHDLTQWVYFGLTHQDSLLSDLGPFAALNAHWQGRHFLTSAAASKLEDGFLERPPTEQVNKAK